MKKIIAVFLSVILVAAVFCGCNKYNSHYNAVAYVHSNTAKSAQMSFYEFAGSQVYKFKCDKGEVINYSASLESGSATVYYDCSGTKTELFSIESGEEVDSSLTEIGSGSVYIIVETSKKCQNGSFEFNVE